MAKYVSKENLELFAAELKKQGGSSKASEIDTESATAGQLLGTDGSGHTEWESPMTDEDVDMLFIEKGTILKMTLDGTERQYRVIKKVGGSVVEVLCQESVSTQKFATSGQTYENGTLDTYLNSTWYGSLSSAGKLAIVDKTFRQDSWEVDNSGNPVYQGEYGASNAYQVSLISSLFGNEITRHVYTLRVQDVIDYLEVTPSMTQTDTTLTTPNLMTMFKNVTAATVDANVALCSARQGNSSHIMAMNGQDGRLDTYTNSTNTNVYPAFQIDLSKITYTEV